MVLLFLFRKMVLVRNMTVIHKVIKIKVYV